ncbi:hypothetical protein [Arthrobacter sp. M4]|uniref:hypothetical protein n=1 Tax=Arthrobacter sp. M4 TaxID=218160 RepID=UPI001CDD0460|nr:hypothetical protein [Arthrobacter sp. M4]MCA4133393.1 hypothetical protein [Arthrobacter sp. M4]
MDLSAAAVELYALAPSEFTAARNAMAKDAKAEGDAELAKGIAKLPKPPVAAWAINMLARHRAPAIDGLVELGEALLQAQHQLDRTALRDLGQKRQRELTAVVREARELAEQQGVNLSQAAADDVESTLRAAMADDDAAAAVRSGQLVRPLESSGFEAVDLTDAVAVPGLPSVARPVRSVKQAEPRKKKDPEEEKKQREAEQRRKAEQERERKAAEADLEEAERSLGEAEADVADASERLAEVSARSKKLAAKVRELKDALEDAEADLGGAERDERSAERAVEVAKRLAARERQAAERARDRLKALG